MKVVLGLGNPGERYANTRHNVGWRYVLAYAAREGIMFGEKAKFQAEIAELTHASGEKVLLVKPLTFYNEAGQAARAILDFYKCEPTDFLVIHDELALPLGTIRVCTSRPMWKNCSIISWAQATYPMAPRALEAPPGMM